MAADLSSKGRTYTESRHQSLHSPSPKPRAGHLTNPVAADSTVHVITAKATAPVYRAETQPDPQLPIGMVPALHDA